MLMTILTVAGALAQAQAVAPATPAAPAAPAGRTLKDLPNTTITYYDVQGKKWPEIQKSLKTVLADPASKQATRLYTYDVAVQIVKATTGQKCTVTSAKAKLTPAVHLPRLVEEAKVSKEVLANWRTYAATAEGDAATDLWFISDRLGGVEQSMAGLPCDQAAPVWNAGLDKLKAQLAEVAAQRASEVRAANAASAALAAEKAKAAKAEQEANAPEDY